MALVVLIHPLMQQLQLLLMALRLRLQALLAMPQAVMDHQALVQLWVD
jgi:hypothetical protein